MIAEAGRGRSGPVTMLPLIRSQTQALVLHTYDPIHVVGEELSGVAGIAAAFIHGSWAARYVREPVRRRVRAHSRQGIASLGRGHGLQLDDHEGLQ